MNYFQVLKRGMKIRLTGEGWGISKGEICVVGRKQRGVQGSRLRKLHVEGQGELTFHDRSGPAYSFEILTLPKEQSPKVRCKCCGRDFS